MNASDDIRWKQRLSIFTKALKQLTKFINKGNLSDLEQQGLIKAFEYTYELAWNLLKDYLEYQGFNDLLGPRDVFRQAFNSNLVNNGDAWMDMLRSRNLTSHSYNQDTADEIANAITNKYFDLFVILEERFNQL